MVEMSKEKETKHNVIVRLISESPITYSSAVFKIAKAIDSEILDDEGLIVIGYDFNDPEPGTHLRRPSKTGKKLSELASRSPGALGDLYAFIKNYKWYQIYIGFAGIVLAGTLLFKLLVRTITGNWSS